MSLQQIWCYHIICDLAWMLNNTIYFAWAPLTTEHQRLSLPDLSFSFDLKENDSVVNSSIFNLVWVWAYNFLNAYLIVESFDFILVNMKRFYNARLWNSKRHVIFRFWINLNRMKKEIVCRGKHSQAVGDLFPN